MGVGLEQWRAAIGSFGGRGLIVAKSLLQGVLLGVAMVVRILLLLAGVESNPGPTNQETLNWLKVVANLSAREGLNAAITFFGNFPGDFHNFSSWKDNFLSEHKKMKQEAHIRLRKKCGGGGKQGAEPPSEFVPYNMMSDNKCTICKKLFNCENDLKDHIKTEHKTEVKRAFSKEAMQVVTEDEYYQEWLGTETTETLEEEEVKKKMQSLQQTNKLLVQNAESQSMATYTKVGDREGGVMDFKRIVLTPQENGTVKRSCVTQQLVDVTLRKRSKSGTENEDPNEKNKSKNTQKQQAQKVSGVVKHVAGESIHDQAAVVAKLVDKEGPEFAASLMKQSQELKEQKQFSPAQTAAILSGTNMTDRSMARLRTAHNKVLGSNPYERLHRKKGTCYPIR